MTSWESNNPFAPFRPNIEILRSNVTVNGSNLDLTVHTTTSQIVDATNFGRAWLSYNNLHDAVNAGTYGYLYISDLAGWGYIGRLIAMQTSPSDVKNLLTLASTDLVDVSALSRSLLQTSTVSGWKSALSLQSADRSERRHRVLTNASSSVQRSQL